MVDIIYIQCKSDFVPYRCLHLAVTAIRIAEAVFHFTHWFKPYLKWTTRHLYQFLLLYKQEAPTTRWIGLQSGSALMPT